MSSERGSRTRVLGVELLSPLSGGARALFYFGLLAFAWIGGPLRVPEIVRDTPAPLLTPVDALRALGLDDLSPGALGAIRVLTSVGLALGGLGLATRLAAPLAALGFLLLHGVYVGAVGSVHTWHLPVYALVALALSPPSPTLSIDRVWARRAPRVGRWLGVRPEGGGVSIARTLVLVAAVGMLFSSGIAKLLDAGPAWVDGHSLSAYLSWSWQHSRPPRWPALAHLLLRHPALLTALSAATLAIELGAVGALVGRRLRHATLAAAAAMHVVIALTMLPLFIAHLWCYLVLVDVRGRDARAPATPGSTEEAGAMRWARRFLLGGACLLFLVVALARIERWPLSHVPMYATYVAPGQVGGVPERDLEDPRPLREIARGCLARGCPWMVPLAIWGRVDWAIVEADRERRPIDDVAARIGVRPLQLRKVVSRAVLETLAFASDAPDPSSGSAVTVLLHALRPQLDPRRLAPEARDPVRLEVTYRLSNGPWLLGKLTWR